MPYLAAIRRTFEDLLVDIRAYDPESTAQRLLTCCIDGDADVARDLLRATVVELTEPAERGP